ncbi:hypothetical protein NITGR_500004 [Nitrospina gracilis 3/211]|uniref:Uncharacterized protein n=1 Tax=Nitrospina gracilis (strain 3/211) TaxID=1266370 RepID=M1ZC96_NITG3|nr:hypothetical protein NITGR_500004 [Nitrospina gracilis 3/211]
MVVVRNAAAVTRAASRTFLGNGFTIFLSFGLRQSESHYLNLEKRNVEKSKVIVMPNTEIPSKVEFNKRREG